MKHLKVLLVEDALDQQKIFESSVQVFNHKNDGKVTVSYSVRGTIDDALATIDGSYDGAILDLKLHDDDDGGNKIIVQLNEIGFRVPVIFVTGYLDLVNEHPLIVNKRARGDDTYENDLVLFSAIKDTGLTHIMGGRGIIEQTLYAVFLKNLLPQIQTWIDYGKADSDRTERALLRHTLNHLLQLLEDDNDKCFPEEAYIFPPLVEAKRTGSIVKAIKNDTHFVVLNPACDLVVRKNGIKTDRILLVEIESSKDIQDKVLEGAPNNEKKRAKLAELFRNNHTDYYHWLPPVKLGVPNGGFLNFRKLSTFSEQDFLKSFNPPTVQISPPFVKDIVARFSSYYARQGQPDLDSGPIIIDLAKAF